MCKHHIKYEEKCTHVSQFQGQVYTIYLQAYMMYRCEKMIGPSTYGCYVKKRTVRHEHSQISNSSVSNRPFYSYGWKRG